jgi:CheY-like chemotaxis protein
MTMLPATVPSTILLLSADRAFVKRLALELHGRGLRVFDAGSGKAADVAMRVCKPELVLVDSLLPDMSGRAWIEMRRREGDLCRMRVIPPEHKRGAVAALAAQVDDWLRPTLPPLPPVLTSFDLSEDRTWIVPVIDESLELEFAPVELPPRHWGSPR